MQLKKIQVEVLVSGDDSLVQNMISASFMLLLLLLSKIL